MLRFSSPSILRSLHQQHSHLNNFIDCSFGRSKQAANSGDADDLLENLNGSRDATRSSTLPQISEAKLQRWASIFWTDIIDSRVL